mgnify:CR=1 FL=1
MRLIIDRKNITNMTTIINLFEPKTQNIDSNIFSIIIILNVFKIIIINEILLINGRK